MLRAAGILVFLMALVACGPSKTERTSIALAERWHRSTTEYQAVVLDDHRVSDDEYEQAVVDTARCLNDNGFETGGIRDVPDGVRKDFMIMQGDHTDNETADAWTTCWRDHLDAVESVYLAQHARLDEDEAALERELLDCLIDNNVADAPSGMSDFELFELLRASDASTQAWFCRERWLVARGKLGATPPD